MAGRAGVPPFWLAGGSPAAGPFSCAAKKRNQKKAAPGVAALRAPLCCLTRRGGGTRPGEAHTTCLAAGLEQSSPTSPRRVELLGAPQGVGVVTRPPCDF